MRKDFVDTIIEQLNQELPDTSVDAIENIARFSRLSALMRHPVVATVEAHGISEAEYNVLAALRRSGAPYELAPSRLQKAVLFTSGGLTPVLDRLQSAGFITREPDLNDRRRTRVVLTDAGREVHEAALQSHIDVSRVLMAPLSERQQKQLSDLLRIVLLSLENPTQSV